MPKYMQLQWHVGARFQSKWISRLLRWSSVVSNHPIWLCLWIGCPLVPPVVHLYPVSGYTIFKHLLPEPAWYFYAISQWLDDQVNQATPQVLPVPPTTSFVFFSRLNPYEIPMNWSSIWWCKLTSTMGVIGPASGKSPAPRAHIAESMEIQWNIKTYLYNI
jgi:hypothetical protein